MSEFDALAPTYDSDFTSQPIGEILRARVHHRLLAHFSAKDHVLEMGCGTGEDALFLSQQGIIVTATDASDEMLAVARTKTAHANNVQVKQLNLADLPTQYVSSFDGAFSNFGALNCLRDWRPLAEWLGERVETGGIVGLGIMSPYCAWEFGWHALHWKWDIALRRLRGDTFGDLQITYPTVKRITDDFTPYFERVHLMPLGLFLPTSALFDVVQKRGWLFSALANLETRFENTSSLAMLADHYWIEFKRK